MCRVQSPRLATVEALNQVVRVPEVEVPDLRALDASDALQIRRRSVLRSKWLILFVGLISAGVATPWPGVARDLTIANFRSRP